MPAYRVKDLEQRFGLSAAVVRSLIRAGHIQPARERGSFHLSFQDLIILRTANALRAADIPMRAINRALQNIRSTLPEGLPLSGQSMAAVGDRIAVREGEALWESNSGQYTLALEPTPKSFSTLASIEAKTVAQSRVVADANFTRAYEMEDIDPFAAIAGYEMTLAADATHIEARINLGRLLHLQKRHRDAEAAYRGTDDTHPLLLFNLAVLLEDRNRTEEAIALYREALALDPNLIDGHFNLARLYELAGDPRTALRHLLVYRRAQKL